MIDTIILLNVAHIGDIFFSQKLIKFLSESNPKYKFYCCIKYNSFLFNDIKTVEIMDLNKNMWLDAHRETLHHKIDDTTLILNTWIGASMKNNDSSVECSSYNIINFMIRMIPQINAAHSIDLVLPLCSKMAALTTLPSTDISKFLSWKSISGKKAIFCYNYKPATLPSITINNHKEFITSMASKYPHYNIIAPKLTDDFVTINDTYPNVFFCDRDFGCEETITCMNVCQVAEIAAKCDVSIHDTVGAQMYFVNDRFFESSSKVICVCHTYYYNNFKGSLTGSDCPDSVFDSRVCFINGDRLYEAIYNVIDRL